MEKWEKLNDTLTRFKVDGGYLYRTTDLSGVALAWSPDIDLTRYQAHLRDAYNQGYKDGVEDAKHGVERNSDV